jgi:hypothetical protein
MTDMRRNTMPATASSETTAIDAARAFFAAYNTHQVDNMVAACSEDAQSELPSEGFSADNYLWNLWPRFVGAVGNAQVADFAPDDHDAPVTVPEPASLALLAFGLTALTISRRKMAMSRDS